MAKLPRLSEIMRRVLFYAATKGIMKKNSRPFLIRKIGDKGLKLWEEMPMIL